MKVVISHQPCNEDWKRGDVIVAADGHAFLVSRIIKDFGEYVALVSLEEGIIWYSLYDNDMKELQKLFAKEGKHAYSHYSKNEYRMYIEGP